MIPTFHRISQVVDGNKRPVGDGFDVTSPMPGPRIRQLSPYLLIDHVGPVQIAPTDSPPGSHRSFETTTVVYDGHLARRNTASHDGASSAPATCRG